MGSRCSSQEAQRRIDEKLLCSHSLFLKPAMCQAEIEREGTRNRGKRSQRKSVVHLKASRFLNRTDRVLKSMAVQILLNHPRGQHAVCFLDQEHSNHCFYVIQHSSEPGVLSANQQKMLRGLFSLLLSVPHVTQFPSLCVQSCMDLVLL